MKFCPNCGTQQEEGALSCPNCGTVFDAQPQPAPAAAPYVNPADHTAEYSAADISDNKVFAMVIYLLGAFGLVIALLARSDSEYLKFQVRQALKITVCECIVTIVSAVLCWTILVPVVGGICWIILLVVRIICFFQICKGLAKEPAIVCKLGFLK